MEARIRKALTLLCGEDVAQSATLDNLGGHASLRIYWRIHLPREHTHAYPRHEHTLMAMVLPTDLDAFASDEGTSSQEETTHKELPFVDVHRYLHALGIPVPQIDLVDMDLGVLLIEDLGHEMFEDLYKDVLKHLGEERFDRHKPIEQLYHGAINLLVDLQRSEYEAKVLGTKRQMHDLPETIAHKRAFDHALWRWELDHYLEWGLFNHYTHKNEALKQKQGEFSKVFDRLADALSKLQKTLVLRDYQSRNIMNKHGRLFMIDFQDALEGPFIYDLVALLRDSYIQLPFVIVRRLVAYYAHQGAAAGLPWCVHQEQVLQAFNLQTVQRKLKDAGRFIFIDKVKGNPDFLGYYTPSIEYVKQALSMLPEFKDLANLIAEFDPAWEAF